MRSFLLASLVFVAGCAAQQTPSPNYTIPESRWVEVDALPPNPADETIDPTFTGEEDFVISYEPGMLDLPEVPGILISERRATRDALYRIRYGELRIHYEQDRLVWAAHREAYEIRLQFAESEIDRLQPSWWDRHKGTALGMAGFVVGSILTVALVAVVDRTAP